MLNKDYLNDNLSLEDLIKLERKKLYYLEEQNMEITNRLNEIKKGKGIISKVFGKYSNEELMLETRLTTVLNKISQGESKIIEYQEKDRLSRK